MFHWILFSSLLWAGPKQKITLHDGSVIIGELTGFDGQSYSFSTDMLGEINLPVAKVRSMHTLSENEVSLAKTPQEPVQAQDYTFNDYNDYKAPQTPTEAKTTKTVRTPLEPQSPASPQQTSVPYNPPNYQLKSTQDPNDVNGSLIYGMNNSTNQQSVNDIQSMMMSDNQLMGLIIGLQSDPDMEKILQNPQIMLYMSTGNLEELQKFPELNRLMSKPELQQIMEMMNTQ